MPGQRNAFRSSVVFVWETLEASNADQCEAVAQRFAGQKSVIAIELSGAQRISGNAKGESPAFQLIALFQSGDPGKRHSSFKLFWRLAREVLNQRQAEFFFENYENSGVWLTAILLRLLGRRTFVLNATKFDDEPRYKFAELRKFIFLLPYQGALTSSLRGRDYLQFLGIPPERIFFGYGTLNITRIQQLSGAPPAPGGMPFDERVFIVAAQFLSADDLTKSLLAYKTYRNLVAQPRLLRIISTAALEEGLCQKVAELEIFSSVTICCSLPPEAFMKELSKAIAVILFGRIDPLGTIVPQAQSLGLPVLVSDTCCASDDLVRSGVNGFMVEQDNPEGLAYFMSLLSDDADLWKEMCLRALKSSLLSDAGNFASAVESLIVTPVR